MTMSIAEAREFVAAIKDEVKGTEVEAVICAPFTMLKDLKEVTAGLEIKVGAQNMHYEEKGAFTGEISPVMVKDAGGAAAIVGHSERRQIFRETDEMINQRLKGALAFDLLGVLCIGETLEEREANKTLEVLECQIRKGLAGVELGQMAKVVVAYEPVWAIGTGKTASKEQAQEVHAFIRGLIASIYEKDIADQTRILYGGSVKPTNVDELMAQPDIDGALVGGALLDAESFGRIINFE